MSQSWVKRFARLPSGWGVSNKTSNADSADHYVAILIFPCVPWPPIQPIPLQSLHEPLQCNQELNQHPHLPFCREWGGGGDPGVLTAGWLILIHTRKHVSSIKPQKDIKIFQKCPCAQEVLLLAIFFKDISPCHRAYTFPRNRCNFGTSLNFTMQTEDQKWSLTH